MALVDVVDLLGDAVETDLDGLAERAGRRDDEGYNYLEAARAGAIYPTLIVHFRDDRAVVFRIDTDGGSVKVLRGDSSMPADRTMTFRSPSGYEEFIGEFIVPAVTATQYLRLFALDSAWPDGSEWITL